MESSGLQSVRASARALRRSVPSLILADAEMHVLFAEKAALGCLLIAFGTAPEASDVSTLPPAMAALIAPLLNAWDAGEVSDCEACFMLSELSFMRVVRLASHSKTLVGIFFEVGSGRKGLSSAKRRYSLTRRELDVLQLVLRGLNAAGVARELCIAESTAADYIKQLLRKTHSRNRPEMVANVFGYWIFQDRGN